MKKLIILTLFLIGNLYANSQKLSTQDSLCNVPCNTLRNALILKTDHEYLQNQMQIVRDSVSTLNNIIGENTNIINNQNDIINLQKQNEKNLSDAIYIKDNKIKVQEEEIKRQRRRKVIAYIFGLASVVYGSYITLL